MSKFNTCLRNGFISFGDDFDSVAEVTHLFGGTAMKLPYRVAFGILGKNDVIAWLPSEEGSHGWHNVPEYGPNVDSHGWNEILTISEYNDNAEENSKRIEKELTAPKMRYVFWREEREGATWYKFYGTFAIDADATRATRDTDQPHVVYRRISKTAECPKVEVVKTVFADSEFSALAGHLVQVDFLDEISFSADCNGIQTGTVSVWPGMKFLVSSVDPGNMNAVCDTRDEKFLQEAKQNLPLAKRKNFTRFLGFTIPRRDFELGYVEVLAGEGSPIRDSGKGV